MDRIVNKFIPLGLRRFSAQWGSNHGSGVIEFLIAMTFLAPLVGLTLGFSYLAYSNLAIGLQMRQALYCGLEGRARFACINSFQRGLSRFRIWGEVRNINLKTSMRQAEFSGLWRAPLIKSKRISGRLRLDEVQRAEKSNLSGNG